MYRAAVIEQGEQFRESVLSTVLSTYQVARSLGFNGDFRA